MKKYLVLIFWSSIAFSQHFFTAQDTTALPTTNLYEGKMVSISGVLYQFMRGGWYGLKYYQLISKDSLTATATVDSTNTFVTINRLNLGLATKQAVGTYIIPSDTTLLHNQIAGKQPQLSGTGFIKASGTTISYDGSTYLTSYTETDPIVKAINGIVKSNGTTISAASSSTDYQLPLTRNTGLIVYAALSNGATAMAFGTNSTVKVTPTATASYTTTVPSAGCECFLIILTSGTSSYTITLGTGFKSTGTLVTGTTSGKVFVVHFISDGTTVTEAGRTAAQ